LLFLKVMDPLLPLGVLSGCLSAYSGVKSVKVKRESVDELSSPVSRPLSPSQQPVKIKYLSNLMKDVEEGITRFRSATTLLPSTWWDDEFKPHHSNSSTEIVEKLPRTEEKASTSNQLTLDDNGTYSSPEVFRSASMDFKVKLPQDFKPLKSKFCGDNFQMHSSSVVTNAFLSPALAEDELLKYLPHVDIVVSFLYSNSCQIKGRIYFLLAGDT